jgi:hypothetical protein
MKIFFYFVFVCMFIFPISLIGKAKDGGIILSTSKGKHLTESHVEIVVMVIEKLLIRSLTHEEIFLIKKNVQREFIKNPEEIIITIENISDKLKLQRSFLTTMQEMNIFEFGIERSEDFVGNQN